MNTDWRTALARALSEDRRVVLVTVAQAAGSTPREAGAALVVDDQGFTGTIGGGHLEFEALRLAREALVAGSPAGTWIVRFPLAARVGQCCGGVATLAFSTFDGGDAPWLDAAAACERSGAAYAVATRIAAGADRLVVTADSTRGSLGDAALDAAAIAAARQRLAGDGTGIVTVGGATLVIDVVRPDPFSVVVFGNGHVGRALVTILGTLPASVRWVDERADDFPPSVPANVEIVVTDAPEDEVRDAPRGAYVIVMTHSHALDYDLITAALARDDWHYLGLIGSKSKRQQFARRLAARGLPDDALNRVTCPIGGRGPKGKEPGVIAVAVTAELLAIREAVSAHDLAHGSAATGIISG